MVTHNVATMRFAQIPKVLTIVVVDMDLAEIHHRLIVKLWKEFVQMEQYAIEMLK